MFPALLFFIFLLYLGLDENRLPFGVVLLVAGLLFSTIPTIIFLIFWWLFGDLIVEIKNDIKKFINTVVRLLKFLVEKSPALPTQGEANLTDQKKVYKPTDCVQSEDKEI